MTMMLGTDHNILHLLHTQMAHMTSLVVLLLLLSTFFPGLLKFCWNISSSFSMSHICRSDMNENRVLRVLVIGRDQKCSMISTQASFIHLAYKLSNMVHVLFIVEVIYIFCGIITSMSRFQKCQHTTAPITISLVCKFCSVRFSLDASEMMTEMYQIIVRTSDKVFALTGGEGP